MSATRKLAAFARGLAPEDVPESTRRVAREAILDTLACAIAGRQERVARGLHAWARGEGESESAGLWGTRQRASAGTAALINGTAAHALDYDDVSWALQGHPSAPLLPAAVALGEARGAGGEELLLAYVAGFEVEARVGQALTRSHYARGWHPTSCVGILGATAAAGRLLGLGEAQLAAAFGIACSRAAGSRMNFGTDTKPLHAGLAARAGVEAASFASLGVTARRDGLEADMGLFDLYGGARPVEIPPLGRPFALEDPGVELKPYPACRFTQATIDAVLALRERHRGAHAESFECQVDPFALEILIYPQPETGLEAKFSLPYCAAVAWLDGWPDLASFSDARAGKPDVQELLRRVNVQRATEPGDVVRVVLESGEQDAERVRVPRGHPERPLDTEQRLRKVRACAAGPLGEARVEQLIAAVDELESLADVSELGRLLATD